MAKLSPGALSDLTKAAGRTGGRVRAGFPALLTLRPGPCAAGVGLWRPKRAGRLLQEEGATSQICSEMPVGLPAESQEGLRGVCQLLPGHFNLSPARTPAMA